MVSMIAGALPLGTLFRVSRALRLDRLSVSARLFLILSLFLLPIGVGTRALIEARLDSIEFTDRELAGLSLISQMRDVITSFSAKPVRRGEIQSRLTQLRGLLEDRDFVSQASQTSLKRLLMEGADSTNANLLTRKLIRNLADDANLTLDPELDSYYVMDVMTVQIPLLFAHASTLYDMQATKLPSGSSQMMVERAAFDDVRLTITDDLIAATRIDRGVGGLSDLLASWKKVDFELERALGSPLDEDDPGKPEGARIEAAARASGETNARAMHKLEAFWGAGFDSLGALLRARIDRERTGLNHNLLATGGVLVLVLLLTVVLLRTITGPLTNLSHTAREIARTGDMTLRVAEWQWRDEIGELIGRFNALMDELSQHRALKEAHARAEEALEALRQAQGQVVEAQRRLQLITDAMPVSLTVYDELDHLALFNAAAVAYVPALSGPDVLGTPQREIVGSVLSRTTMLEELPTDERTEVIERWIRRSEDERVLERELAFVDGRKVRNIVRHLSDGWTISCDVDITNLRRAQDELAQAERLAALGTLVTGIAHEINTPLGVARTAASSSGEIVREMSEKHADGSLTDKQFVSKLRRLQEGASLIDANLARSAALVQRFKLLSADQAGWGFRRITLRPYIEGVVSEQRARLSAMSATLVLDIPDDLVLNTDPGAISQVVINLIENSLNHAFLHGQPGIIEIIARPGEGGLSITYRDDGAGVDRKDLKRLFEPFFTTKRGRGGVGIGLTVVFNLITDHLQGHIEPHLVRPSGLEYRIWLPYALRQRGGDIGGKNGPEIEA